MPIGSRTLLLIALATFATACGRGVQQRPSAAASPAATLPPEVDRWNQEAQGILSDGLHALRTFDAFHAFRVSTAAGSSLRLPSELSWDPPTSAEWDEATHVSIGLHGRAEQLFNSVSATRIDPGFWREQRDLADATHDLLDLGDALRSYRARVDALPPGDAAGGLPLLDRAWSLWDAAAARWSLSRAEPIGCTGS